MPRRIVLSGVCSSVTIAALYRFVSLPDYVSLRDPILHCCHRNSLLGTLLLAEEGINGTISGTRQGICNLLQWFNTDPRLANIEPRWTEATYQPFERLKVRLKKEIITLRAPEADPLEHAGEDVLPEAWNALIQQPDVLLLDARNRPEIDLGSFEGALDPALNSFGEFTDFVRENLDPNRHRRIAMFCTGGIRCEKASSYLLAHGFAEVYQLKGGILNYLQRIPEQDSLWRGECFVFDQRRALNHDLQPRFKDKETARENE